MAIDPRFFSGASNVLADMGYGIATGGFKNMFGEATKRQQEMEPGRDAASAAAQKEIEDAALRAKYAGILRSMGMEEHAKIVEDGLAAPGEVYMDALEQKNAKPSGPYAGTDMDAQNWNILLRGASDPAFRASPEYAAAYAQQTQPQVTYVQTENGSVPVMTTPQMPAWLQPPTGQQQGAPSAVPSSPAMPGQSPGLAPLAYPAPLQTGPTVGAPLPGTQRPSTESETRIGMMATTILKEVPTFHAKVGAMDNMGQQILAMGGPLANPWLDGDYQQAAQSIATSASQVLYALSGAAAGDAETEKRIREVTPVFGDKPGTIRDKIRRFDNYVVTLANASGDPAIKQLAQEVLTRARRGASGPQMAPGGAPAPSTKTTSTGVTWSM